MYLTEKGSLIDVSPTFLEDWNYLKNDELGLYPKDFSCGSSQKVWWKCSVCGFEWQASIINRNVRGNGCPKCAKSMSHNAKQIVNIDTGEVFESAAEASREYGIGKSSICFCLKGKTQKAGGFKWKYFNTNETI